VQYKMAFRLDRNAILVTDCVCGKSRQRIAVATSVYAPALAVLASEGLRVSSAASRKYNR
jgi:hypothetical protein